MRAFISASSLITASRTTGFEPEAGAGVASAGEDAGFAVLALAAVDDAGVFVESLGDTGAPVSAILSVGTSAREVRIEVAVFADCCATEDNGANPQHKIATAGTAFQGSLLIQPLAFAKEFVLRSTTCVRGIVGSEDRDLLTRSEVVFVLR
jgi:hypothetical protein